MSAKKVNAPVDKKLYVEGNSDKLALPYLLEKLGVPWEVNNLPVDIVAVGSIEKLINPLITLIQQEELRIIGIVCDADSSPQHRWLQIRIELINYCNQANLNNTIPDNLPESGCWIGELGPQKKVGVWLMPGNCQQGMFEDFLADLVDPNESGMLWQHAQSSTDEVTNIPDITRYKPVHRTKAILHCWLAWQDSPGDRIEIAIKSDRFDISLGNASAFKIWFCNLFDL